MKVLFASSNPSKVARFKNKLEEHNIELITLKDIDVDLNVEETGKDALENAYIKAKSYFDATGLPTIGMDDNLFIDGIPEDKQPGTHVRRVNGHELTDDEMIEYYTRLVSEYGGKLTAKWVYGMVICTKDDTYRYTWSKDHFYLVDTPSEKRNERYPLNSISMVPELNKYFVDLTDEDRKHMNKNNTDDGVIEFILNSLSKKLKPFSFDEENDQKIYQVLKGQLDYDIYLFLKHEHNNTLPYLGEHKILIFDNEKKACIIKTVDVEITEFKNIDSKLRNRFHFKDNEKVILETFKLVVDLTQKRLDTAKKIVESNKEIFGTKEHQISEINAGFNNDIFDIDDKFIIKVCANLDKESEFEKEASFYEANADSKNLPRLFLYDDSKKVVPYVYEIMEKIHGKSLYYYWYKMNEDEREQTIKNIVDILKVIHKDAPSYDWCSYIKTRITSNYEKVKTKFTNEEQSIIEKSFAIYHKYLSENNFFVTIHNDLHFDNIIVSNDNLYLIDFNDTMNAPLDFDLRILYMCKSIPWRWANTEMDPYQKPEHYQNIDTYLKKYYTKLSEIKYLEERMKIYYILNEIDLLTRFNGEELKQNILKLSSELL